jgi:hypothetical protein
MVDISCNVWRTAVFRRLHLPTGRVTIEELLRHLVREHAIGPISDAWETTLREAEEFFEEIQRKRLAP